MFYQILYLTNWDICAYKYITIWDLILTNLDMYDMGFGGYKYIGIWGFGA